MPVLPSPQNKVKAANGESPEAAALRGATLSDMANGSPKLEWSEPVYVGGGNFHRHCGAYFIAGNKNGGYTPHSAGGAILSQPLPIQSAVAFVENRIANDAAEAAKRAAEAAERRKAREAEEIEKAREVLKKAGEL